MLVFVAALGLWLGNLSAQEEKGAGKSKQAGTETSEKEFPYDKGPDKIDVSKYPKEQQENYKVFAKKCSKCHTLARPINAPLALPEEWEAYVNKMVKKKRSGVDGKSAKKIIDFLTYDSSVRKKDLVEKKLQEKEAQK